jgi:hypothetical protein
MKAISPDGNDIIGTLEVIEGVARADVALAKNGRLKVEFLGETDVDWNTQVTKTEKAERLFVCSQHKVWREDQVKRATEARRQKR